MGMYDASGQLSKAMKTFLTAWTHAKEAWSDEKAAAFEERFVATLQQDTNHAVDTMVHMGGLLDQIRRDCSDRES
jgi:hypothetical protein